MTLAGPHVHDGQGVGMPSSSKVNSARLPAAARAPHASSLRAPCSCCCRVAALQSSAAIRHRVAHEIRRQGGHQESCASRSAAPSALGQQHRGRHHVHAVPVPASASRAVAADSRPLAGCPHRTSRCRLRSLSSARPNPSGRIYAPIWRSRYALSSGTAESAARLSPGAPPPLPTGWQSRPPRPKSRH